MNGKKILLVEDNIDILKANKRMLELNGFYVIASMNIEDAEKQLNNNIPDVIVLDILLPDGSGLELCKHIREQLSDIPILFLSALDENSDIIAGLRAGGDDYLAKPYAYEVLLTRIETLIRRSERTQTIILGAYKIDNVLQKVYKNEEDLMLKPREFALMRIFIENIGEYIQSDILYEKVWGECVTDDIRTVYTHISLLRKKLEMGEDSELMIELKRGKGYRMIYHYQS